MKYKNIFIVINIKITKIEFFIKEHISFPVIEHI